MMAFRGPVLAFGCHRSHATARNAEQTGKFVMNFGVRSATGHAQPG
jgi:flavin reductase (DIM6/NTAB) family NADH-FMN oxidoreductase RutF